MTATCEVSKVLSEAFTAALLLTGSTEIAEGAVLDGIEALDFGDRGDEILLVEAVRSAIRRRADFPSQSERLLSYLSWELQRLILLPPTARDCFVLRVLLGMSPGSSSEILRLAIQEIDEALCTALQELPLLEVSSSTWRAER